MAGMRLTDEPAPDDDNILGRGDDRGWFGPPLPCPPAGWAWGGQVVDQDVCGQPKVHDARAPTNQFIF